MSHHHLEQLAREKAGQGPEWEVWLYEWLPKGGKPELMQLTGAVAPRLKGGPRKGKPNWRKKDPATVRSVLVRPAEIDAYEAKWERETGRCAACDGEGDVTHSWSATEGAKSRPCRKCRGTGAAKAAERSLTP